MFCQLIKAFEFDCEEFERKFRKYFLPYLWKSCICCMYENVCMCVCVCMLIFNDMKKKKDKSVLFRYEDQRWRASMEKSLRKRLQVQTLANTYPGNKNKLKLLLHNVNSLSLAYSNSRTSFDEFLCKFICMKYIFIQFVCVCVCVLPSIEKERILIWLVGSLNELLLCSFIHFDVRVDTQVSFIVTYVALKVDPQLCRTDTQILLDLYQPRCGA